MAGCRQRTRPFGNGTVHSLQKTVPAATVENHPTGRQCIEKDPRSNRRHHHRSLHRHGHHARRTGRAAGSIRHVHRHQRLPHGPRGPEEGTRQPPPARPGRRHHRPDGRAAYNATAAMAASSSGCAKHPSFDGTPCDEHADGLQRPIARFWSGTCLLLEYWLTAMPHPPGAAGFNGLKCTHHVTDPHPAHRTTTPLQGGVQ